MQKASDPVHVKRMVKIALTLSLAANMVPILFAFYTIASLSYYRAPLFTEIRILIILLGLGGAFIGMLAILKRTRSRVLVVCAILLGLIAPLQHAVFCGSDALHQKFILFCPMLWGVRIP